MFPRSLTLAALAALVALAPLGASSDSHEPRVERERYVAGVGDVVCGPSGVGCVRFAALGGETRVRVSIEDEVRPRVGANLCGGVACAYGGNLCGAGEFAITGGDVLTVFLHAVNSLQSCGLAPVGVATAGVVVAEFT